MDYGFLFPAHAGVIPVVLLQVEQSSAFPRTCGGDPASIKAIELKFGFSPHMRG